MPFVARGDCQWRRGSPAGVEWIEAFTSLAHPRMTSTAQLHLALLHETLSGAATDLQGRECPLSARGPCWLIASGRQHLSPFPSHNEISKQQLATAAAVTPPQKTPVPARTAPVLSAESLKGGVSATVRAGAPRCTATVRSHGCAAWTLTCAQCCSVSGDKGGRPRPGLAFHVAWWPSSTTSLHTWGSAHPGRYQCWGLTWDQASESAPAGGCPMRSLRVPIAGWAARFAAPGDSGRGAWGGGACRVSTGRGGGSAGACRVNTGAGRGVWGRLPGVLRPWWRAFGRLPGVQGRGRSLRGPAG